MLKQLLSLLGIILLCGGAVQAQGKLKNAHTRSPYTYIYKISNKEAYKIFKEGNQAVDASQFQIPIDSFTVKEGFRKQLTQGHYWNCNSLLEAFS